MLYFLHQSPRKYSRILSERKLQFGKKWNCYIRMWERERISSELIKCSIVLSIQEIKLNRLKYRRMLVSGTTSLLHGLILYSNWIGWSKSQFERIGEMKTKNSFLWQKSKRKWAHEEELMEYSAPMKKFWKLLGLWRGNLRGS